MFGAQLRALRESRGLTLERVAAESRRLATRFSMPGLTLDIGWISRIEREDHDFSAIKLISLCIVYKIPPSTLLLMMLKPGYVAVGERPSTSLLPEADILSDDCSVYPSFRPSAPHRNEKVATTGLLESLASEATGDMQLIPSPHGLHKFGLIGNTDYTLWPIISPGAIATIDPRQRTISPRSAWASEYDRPIYFLELRRNYVCSWCDLSKDKRWLSIVPHPMSPVSVSHLRFPEDVDIVGRVVSISMRLNAPLAPARERSA